MLLALAACVLACASGVLASSGTIVQTLYCNGTAGSHFGPAHVTLAVINDTEASVVYIWSTVGTPTLLLLAVPAGTANPSLFNSWSCPTFDEAENLFDFSGITLPGTVNGMSAIVFSEIIEFNDGNGNDAVYTPSKYIGSIDMTNLAWMDPVFDAQTGLVNITTVPIGNFSFSIYATLNAKSGRESVLPALPYNGNSGLFTIIINNYPYQNLTSKLAVETFVPASGLVDAKTAQSIDDEYMPKIFQYTTITSYDKESVYMAFRPVAFGSSARPDGNITLGQMSSLLQANTSNLYNSLVNITSYSSNTYGYLTFGQDGDGVYNFPYILMDFIHGAGTPASDSLSTGLILVMVVTISLPGVALIFSILYILRMKAKFKSGYERIN